VKFDNTGFTMSAPRARPAGPWPMRVPLRLRRGRSPGSATSPARSSPTSASRAADDHAEAGARRQAQAASAKLNGKVALLIDLVTGGSTSCFRAG
jgi:hypothetical protein